MKVVFRVDASARMGVGHLMRCLTLAEVLRERGAQISFVCREHTGNLIPLVRQKAMSVKALPTTEANATETGEDYASWLGVTQAVDAEQSIEALNGEKPDWLVVDHYGLDIEWEQRLRPHVGKLIVIDDLANRHHDCDVLLDQNFSAEGERRYSGLVPDACRLLAGPRYALLRPEYADYRRKHRFRDGQVKKVLVFFGGSDPQNMTGKTLEALSRTDLKDLEVDVVVGANNPHRKSIEQQAFHRPFTNLHEPRPHLADLMAKADLALGAGGATTWERMCLGLPAVVILIAENQRPGTEALAAVKLIQYVGQASDMTPESISKEVVGLISNPKRLIELSVQNQLMVDGLGAMRVREVMMPTDTVKLQLRAAYQEDMISYFNWANDPEVRKNAIHTDPVPWAAHTEWFTKKLSDPNSHLYVLDAAGLPVGQIRFDEEGKQARIDYSLDTLVRGRGWGAKLVSLGSDILQKIKPTELLAEVKTENQASRSVFLRLGFTLDGSNGGLLIFHRNPEKSNEVL
ncbi:UDP-2,4-diacetamido-2,4,6-trideoxy-beta-L-altropyranose hydrolase [Sulfurirhabdus autotrophica]|uniref:UDP-2,4-diacetamido-2,4, 6-trideoxy-beta-L-altropyranose hydrolase n=1 Tax=Sulfurirhabdus autotrophica TaxID=1706046 RepID=A0A4R3XZA8_9PROT|nr:UDP-2,4-diacetamido-2,4,6-trideoxy-beta-L-altropyranose hydrolase [Sulfurirhabdus autotrophica]TCV84261.1 UDP-2,4-diacetamido-2,4,6-trideoxy-beta-L-altropyranose hydrolase [Sulfurirhabdus autotrophica]